MKWLTNKHTNCASVNKATTNGAQAWHRSGGRSKADMNIGDMHTHAQMHASILATNTARMRRIRPETQPLVRAKGIDAWWSLRKRLCLHLYSSHDLKLSYVLYTVLLSTSRGMWQQQIAVGSVWSEAVVVVAASHGMHNHVTSVGKHPRYDWSVLF